MLRATAAPWACSSETDSTPAAVVDGNPKISLSSTPSTSMTTSGERQPIGGATRHSPPENRAMCAVRKSRASM